LKKNEPRTDGDLFKELRKSRRASWRINSREEKTLSTTDDRKTTLEEKKIIDIQTYDWVKTIIPADQVLPLLPLGWLTRPCHNFDSLNPLLLHALAPQFFFLSRNSVSSFKQKNIYGGC
jgi:hypothetical protein